jgi:putative phosphoesterase
MRILLIADIHSNWPALRAIDEPFDACLFVGDLVDYGIQAPACIDWLAQNASVAIRGNHDHAVAQRIHSKGDGGLRRLAAITREYHWKILSATQLKFLSRLPVTKSVEIDNTRFHLVHATPWDPLDEYLWQDPVRWQQRTKDIDCDILCVGHSHVPFEVITPTCRVVNPGSVGQPRDGDPRCSFAIIEKGHVTFHRRSYDIDEVLYEFEQAGFPHWVIEMQRRILTSGGTVTKDEMDLIV